MSVVRARLGQDARAAPPRPVWVTTAAPENPPAKAPATKGNKETYYATINAHVWSKTKAFQNIYCGKKYCKSSNEHFCFVFWVYMSHSLSTCRYGWPKTTLLIYL
jgi:hypothetical protein